MSILNEEGLPLHTRANWQIPNEQAPEKPPAARQAAIELMAEFHPNAKLRSITAIYNCMGMVFSSRRTHIRPLHLRKILQDDGFSQVQEAEVDVGDLVVYRDGNEVTHVGIVVSKIPDLEKAVFQFKVLSKWGHDGEYIHDLRDVPAVFGNAVEFHTDRTLP